MVENIMLTIGMMNRIIFRRLRIPFVGLSSMLKTVNEIANRNSVYAMIILLLIISAITYFIILSIIIVGLQ